MIINIKDELFEKALNIVKSRNNAIYNELKKIEPIKDPTKNYLEKARETKTNNIKENIKQTIKSLYSQDIAPTKYQINKLTKISYVTLAKYYEDALQEVKNENE